MKTLESFLKNYYVNNMMENKNILEAEHPEAGDDTENDDTSEKNKEVEDKKVSTKSENFCTNFSQKESKKSLEDKKKKLESAARSVKKKAQKRLGDILSKLQDAEKAEENRLKGELLTANLYRVEKGASGDPGELQGSLVNDAVLGELLQNTEKGISPATIA